LKRRGERSDFSVVSNPEFLKEGAAVEDFMRPDRVVVGAEDERAIAMLRQLYAPFQRNHDRIIIMSVRSAELTKYAANAMLATRISFMNEIANLAEAIGADVEDVRRGIGADPRIGYQFLYPGAGYGGSCFPKDVRALQRTASETGREASSRTLISDLVGAGARVRAYDPAAGHEAKRLYRDSPGVEIVDSALAALEAADALAVVTEWREFRSPDFAAIKAKLKTPAIFDGRNLYDPGVLKQLGFEYFAIGRRA
jgi:UDPglucose 6-dehydrogenase